MKILHVIDSAGIYGAEVVLLNLMAEQQHMGLVPILASLGDIDSPEKQLEIEARARGIKVCRLRMRRGFSLHGTRQLLHTVQQEKITIIHSHGYKGDILLGMLPSWKRHVPMLRTMHGWTSTRTFSKIRLYETLDKLCLRKMAAIVWVNDAAARQQSGLLTGITAHVVENGIPPLSFPDPATGNNDPIIGPFCQDGFILGTIGRLSEEKGTRHLINAMELVTKTDKQCKLVILGEGRLQETLEQQIRDRGLSQQILLPGYRQNAAQLLPLFDAFILPSLTEGLPIVLLEAMQAAIPIVATTVGGIPNVLENGHLGTLVAPGSAAELAEGIFDIRRDPEEAQKKAARAKDIALSHFSSRRMAEEYSKIYMTIL